MRIHLLINKILNDVDEEMKLFLRYVENSSDDLVEETESELLKEIHRKVKEIKSSKKLEVEYMTLLEKYEEIAEEAEERGIEKGIEKGMKALVLKMLQNGMSKELVAKGTGISKEQIEEWENETKELSV